MDADAIKHSLESRGLRCTVQRYAVMACLMDHKGHPTAAEIFKAVADPTRRAVFERLADGEKNATQLRGGLAISQPAMSQHLAVLRSAGLVAEQRSGRNVNYRVKPEGLAQMYQWLQRYQIFWPERMEALKQLLREMDQ